ncbi:MAG: SRPBCC family protein [Bacteroidetes bacterium]|nr:SRPBCC family protein [Bacteroidota bacterium]
MPTITLSTHIKSSIDICFDLSTSIDLHKLSTAQTNEEAIAGTTTGLIKLNETVTWQATHFGIRQHLTTKITAYQKPFHFRDEQIKGVFKLMKHDHYFEQQGDEVIMKDVFEFESPFGIIGKLFNKLVLTQYMTRFLIMRNELIKKFAESDKWKMISGV